MDPNLEDLLLVFIAECVECVHGRQDLHRHPRLLVGNVGSVANVIDVTFAAAGVHLCSVGWPRMKPVVSNDPLEAADPERDQPRVGALQARPDGFENNLSVAGGRAAARVRF